MSKSDKEAFAIVDAVRQRDNRIADGTVAMERCRSLMPSGPVEIPERLANWLRQILFDRANRHTPRYQITGVAEEVEFSFTTTNIEMRVETYKELLEVFGVPVVATEWHGSCDDCVFGPDRGYSAPCGGCGSGHPCFTPKEGTDAAS